MENEYCHYNHNPETLEPEQRYPINENRFKVRNYGDIYFYPESRMIDGLKEVIVFRENTLKHDIPNGSVWIYDIKKPYISEILKEDVGCGISAFIIEPIDFNESIAEDIVKIISEEKIKIGRGNHFIDFTGPLPLIGIGNMILIHSDFNFSKKVPDNYEQAIEMVEKSEEIRIETLNKIINRMHISGEFYKSWIHNFIEVKDDTVIYIKGAISLIKTGMEGILACNPYEGFHSYISRCKPYYGYMQHGVGKIQAGNPTDNENTVVKKGKVQGMIIGPRKPNNLEEYYQSIDEFSRAFGLDQRYLGRIRPRIVISTG
jgi:hypothetical protein